MKGEMIMKSKSINQLFITHLICKTKPGVYFFLFMLSLIVVKLNAQPTGAYKCNAEFTFDPLPAFSPCLINMVTGKAKVHFLSDPKTVAYQHFWEFDDPNSNSSNPNTSTDKSPTHEFFPGSYEVYHRVNNSGDPLPCSDARTEKIFIGSNGVYTLSFEVDTYGGPDLCFNDDPWVEFYVTFTTNDYAPPHAEYIWNKKSIGTVFVPFISPSPFNNRVLVAKATLLPGDQINCQILFTEECIPYLPGTATSSNFITMVACPPSPKPASDNNKNRISSVISGKNEVVYSAYPNPFSETVNVDVGCKEGIEHYTISVLDQAGRVVYTKEVTCNHSEESRGIDLSDLQSGFYYLSITNTGGGVAERQVLIKQ